MSKDISRNTPIYGRVVSFSDQQIVMLILDPIISMDITIVHRSLEYVVRCVINYIFNHMSTIEQL